MIKTQTHLWEGGDRCRVFGKFIYKTVRGYLIFRQAYYLLYLLISYFLFIIYFVVKSPPILSPQICQ